MALTELIFGAPKKVEIGTGPFRLGSIQLDCSVEEVHTDEAEITEHHVEEGSIITDHIRKLPSSLEITGVITNTPIMFLASVFAKSPVQGSLIPSQDRVSDGYDFLQQLFDMGVLLTIATSLRDYDNMAIKVLVVRRNKETGQALDCTLVFKEIKKARALAIDLPIPKEVQNNASENKGDKQKKPPKKKQEGVPDSAMHKLREGGQTLAGFIIG